MDNVIDLSDNENDNEKIFVRSDPENLQIELSAILSKYANTNLGTQNNCSRRKDNDDISPNTSDNEVENHESGEYKLNNMLKFDTNLMSSNVAHKQYNETDRLESQNVKKGKKRKSQDKGENALTKMLKEQEKRDKQQERAKFKIAEADKKEQQTALAEAYKNLRQNIQLVTVLLDQRLISADYGSEIITALQEAQVFYEITEHLVSGLVTWRWTNGPCLDRWLAYGNSKLPTCSDVLVVFPWRELVQVVHEGQLCQRVQYLQDLLPDKRLTLAIFGLAGYFRYQKAKKAAGASDKQYKDMPTLTRLMVETELAKIQLLYNCAHRLLETRAELNAAIHQYTKAAANLPLRAQNCDDDYAALRYSSKGAVRVDVEGRGLRTLWKQQLTQFPLAKLGAADAVAAVYEGPRRLAMALAGLESPNLSELAVRRAAGPLSTQRKLGQALTDKIKTMFTSREPHEIL